MTPRPQRTLRRPAEVSGFGLFSGVDVTVRLLPAPEHHGIAFQRIDLPTQPRVPALIRYVEPGLRRTVLARGAARVQMVEHLLAALAGLGIDNCLVQVNAEEPPVGDGSADHFVAALLDAGRVDQHAARQVLQVTGDEQITLAGAGGSLEATPATDGQLHITYDLDYSGTPIGRQSCAVSVTPGKFVRDVSFARTFVLESEVAGMRAQGFGLRATTANVLVFDRSGPVATRVRAANECARHKVLDCVGDFALLGCDLIGQIHARQSGHAHNQELVRRLEQMLRNRSRLAAAG